MIVKNESAVIERCLGSVRGLIDYWVIVDTGSVDGTEELIQECLRGCPGQLYRQRWVNFEVNRNAALHLAMGKGDYLFFIDADEQLVGSIDKSKLDEDFYTLGLKERSLTDAYRVSLIKSFPGWSWKGVLHEYLDPPYQMKGRILSSAFIDGSARDGNRTRDPEKFLKDAQILEQALLKDPENSRYLFYLAQSYGNAKDYPSALCYYEKRAAKGGSPDEVFWSFYCIGMIQQHLQMDLTTVISSYSKAHAVQPERAEPFYQMANYYLQMGLPLLGYLAAKPALSLSRPVIAANIHLWVYQYALLLTYAECALAIGHREEALEAYRKLLTSKGVPDDIKRYVESVV